MTKFKKLVAASLVSLALAGCAASPDDNFKKSETLYFEGHKITFVQDHSMQRSTGVYIIDSEQDGLNTSSGLKSNYVGKVNNLNAFYVEDHETDNGYGFYIFKTDDGKIVNVNSSSSNYTTSRSGKTTSRHYKPNALVFSDSLPRVGNGQPDVNRLPANVLNYIASLDTETLKELKNLINDNLATKAESSYRSAQY